MMCTKQEDRRQQEHAACCLESELGKQRGALWQRDILPGGVAGAVLASRWVLHSSIRSSTREFARKALKAICIQQ